MALVLSCRLLSGWHLLKTRRGVETATIARQQLTNGARNAESSAAGNPLRKQFSGKLRKVVMQCELCSSGERERDHRLCLPCMEAMARLWKIVSSAAVPAAEDAVREQAAVRTKAVPIIAVTPNFGGLWVL
jgi:hypothetical protein